MNTLQVVCPHGKVIYEDTYLNTLGEGAIKGVPLAMAMKQDCNCTPEPCEACMRRNDIKSRTTDDDLHIRKLSNNEMNIRWLLKQHCKCGGAKQ